MPSGDAFHQCANIVIQPGLERRVEKELFQDVLLRMPTPGSDAAWLEVITLAGGDLTALLRDERLNRPMLVMDAPFSRSEGASDPNALRRRIWETRMRGGFWGGTATMQLSSGSSAVRRRHCPE